MFKAWNRKSVKKFEEIFINILTRGFMGIRASYSELICSEKKRVSRPKSWAQTTSGRSIKALFLMLGSSRFLIMDTSR